MQSSVTRPTPHYERVTLCRFQTSYRFWNTLTKYFLFLALNWCNILVGVTELRAWILYHWLYSKELLSFPRTILFFHSDSR